MDEIKAKQQVVEKIKESSKILVTVSDSPSVDALSAALGLTLLLDKQEKYATAIFSGETPPAIAFLEPEKTFDDTTDSLRDFIIALNKEKADHLRYKVEDDAVKIFITPYKTTITQDDLEFSQGDYNVELVIALGVDNQESLDKALDNHGQILHDAAIITLTAGDQSSDLGGIDWHDANSSSLSEMVAGLAEALKVDKKKSLLDGDIATALLTGIVAETDRFSNEHTTSKVMTVAANLMAAGADQQLIATELQQAQAIAISDESAVHNEVSDDNDADSEAEVAVDKAESTTNTTPKDATQLTIEHDSTNETLADLDERVRGEHAAHEKIEEEIDAIEEEAEKAAEERHQQAVEATKPTVIPTETHAYVTDEASVSEPTFGGALNATTDQAEDDARRAVEDEQNKTILSHAYIGDASETPSGFPGTPETTPGSTSVNEVEDAAVSAPASETEPDVLNSIALGGEKTIQPLAQPDASEQATTAPQSYTPPAPATPADLGLPLPPPIPDFSQGLPTIPSPIPNPNTDQPLSSSPTGILGDILAPEPQSQPPVLDYEMTNTTAAPGTAYAFDTPAMPALEQPVQPAQPMPPVQGVPVAGYAEPTPSTYTDPALVQPQVQQPQQAAPNPGQFQIPGQQ